MSLLLEALKKAELAKQQGAAGPPPAEGAPANAQPGGSLSLEPMGGASQPLMTRDRLPDITQPLEIFTEDLASPNRPGDAAANPNPAAAPVRPEAAGRPTGGGEVPLASASEEAERASARQLFESKTGEYAPRRVFPLIAGALGVVVVGVIGYFAYQIAAPRPSFYTGPSGGKPPPPAAVGSVPVQPATPASPAPAAAAPVPAAAPDAPTAQAPAAPIVAQASTGTAATPPQPTPAAGTVQRPAVTRATRAPAAAGAADEPVTPRPASAARPPVRVTTSGPRIDPNVERGWEALQTGDLARAAEEYNRALRANPTDRDALLGLAAIELRTQNVERAEARYTKVLELDPRDAYANAQLIALRGGGAVQAESRLQTLLAQQPDATLSFALGNQYASQRRWAEAQQAYFAAFTGDPENADYAYNLAVSLDHLRQPRLALEYYQRALKLAGNRPVGFNTTQVEARVRDLQR